MTHMTHDNTLPKECLSEEWALSEEEKKILSEGRIQEYYEKVEKYSEERDQTCKDAGGIVVASPVLGGGAALIAHVIFISDMALSQSANLIIGLSITCSVTIAIWALTALISSKAQVPSIQNPKDWKNEILSQEASKKESPSRDASNALGVTV